MIHKKASQKLIGIARMLNFISALKKKLLIRTFFEFQFNYCPLLRTAYDDYSSAFEELLEKMIQSQFIKSI